MMRMSEIDDMMSSQLDDPVKSCFTLALLSHEELDHVMRGTRRYVEEELDCDLSLLSDVNRFFVTLRYNFDHFIDNKCAYEYAEEIEAQQHHLPGKNKQWHSRAVLERLNQEFYHRYYSNYALRDPLPLHDEDELHECDEARE